MKHIFSVSKEKDTFVLKIIFLEEKDFSKDENLLNILGLRFFTDCELSFYDKNGNIFVIDKKFLKIFCKDKEQAEKIVKNLMNFL